MSLSNTKPNLFRIQLDDDLIRHLYLDQYLSAQRMADKLEVNVTTIRRRIHALGINRNMSEALKAEYKTGRKPTMLKLDNEALRHLYLDEKMTPLQIAKRFNYSSSQNIIIRLRNMGLVKGNIIYHGANHPSWRGGKYRSTDAGYIQLWMPEHPRANKRHYVLEHIVVWEEYYHKSLPEGYVIHHLNGIKNDNRPENLVAMKKGEHIHQAEPYKKRIRQLEIEKRQLKHALESSQLIFCVGEN